MTPPLRLLPGGQHPLIHLREKRRALAHERCHHRHFLVDHELATVECRDCGAQLDPIQVLLTLAREETHLEQLLAQLEAVQAWRPVPCPHCGAPAEETS